MSEAIPGPADFRREAELFVSIMGRTVPELRLDFSPASLIALEQFIAANFDPPGSKFVGDTLPIGVGCYIGEVIAQSLGGRWGPAGEQTLTGGSTSGTTYPLEKARRRFAHGPAESLSHYYATVKRFASSLAEGQV